MNQPTFEQKEKFIEDCSNNKILEINTFLNDFAETKKNQKILEDTISSALIKAAESGYLNLVELLFNYGANVKYDESHALRKSASNGHLNIVKFLLENGANIHDDNDAAFCFACEYGHLKVVKYLIDAKADIHVDNNKAMSWSIERGHVEVVKLLKENGCDLFMDECSPLRSSAVDGHLPMIQYAISEGINIDELYGYNPPNIQNWLDKYEQSKLLDEKLSTELEVSTNNNHDIKKLKKKI